MKSLVIAIAGLLLATTLEAQLTATPLKEANLPLDGFTYVLPKTVLTATVTYKQIKQTPGPYAQYAERFLGLSTVIQAEQTSHELLSVSLASTAVPDQSAWFHVKQTDNKRHVALKLSPEGFLLGCNLSQPETSAPALPPISEKRMAEAKPEQPQATTLLTRDMQQATSTVRLAELAAAQIFTIRETRMSLLQQETEHTPSDGGSFRLILDELNRMETHFLELFTGTKTSTYLVKQLEFEPKREEEVVLFRFNLQNGMVDKNDLSGSPVTMKLTKKAIPDMGTLKKREEKKPALPGIFYRIPCPTSIAIYDTQQTYVQTTISLPQLGSINVLPITLTGTFRLSPDTGSLLEAGR